MKTNMILLTDLTFSFVSVADSTVTDFALSRPEDDPDPSVSVSGLLASRLMLELVMIDSFLTPTPFRLIILPLNLAHSLSTVLFLKLAASRSVLSRTSMAESTILLSFLKIFCHILSVKIVYAPTLIYN